MDWATSGAHICPRKQSGTRSPRSGKRAGSLALSKVGTTFTPEWYQPRSALQAACIGFLGCKHVRMADSDVRWLKRLENYDKALGMLQRALQIASAGALSELEELGLIQTFKSTHELSWLLLKDYLADQGVSGISGSRDAVREAVVRELLPAGTEDIWMAMIRSRNLTSHTYNPALAHEIAELIQRSYAPALQGLQQELLARAQRR